MANTDITFKAENISFGYNDYEILNNAELSCKAGDTVSISGEVGSGKTSLLYILGLLTPPTSGQIYISGSENSQIDCLSLPLAEKHEFIKDYFAYLFHEPRLMPQWNIFDNISLPLIAKGYTKQERQSEIEKYCALLGINKFYDDTKTVSELSTGQRKLISIARALVQKPKILIADEPVANLDEDTQIKTAKILETQAKKNKMIIIAATHLSTAKKQFKKRYKIINKKLLRNKDKIILPN
jgi:ABC-type lipoprotein export system ATPase subunit